MMMGLVLDASAPLYGRAQEIIPIKPLGAGWIPKALKLGLVRQAVAHHEIEGKRWLPGNRWWGTGLDKTLFEIDVLAESADRDFLLACEVKSTITAKELKRIESDLQNKVQKLPISKSYRRIIYKIIVADTGNQRAKILIPGKAVFKALK